MEYSNTHVEDDVETTGSTIMASPTTLDFNESWVTDLLPEELLPGDLFPEGLLPGDSFPEGLLPEDLFPADSILDDLFTDGNFCRATDTIHPSNNLPVNDNSPNQWLPPLQSANDSHTCLTIKDGSIASELLHIPLDEQRDTSVIIDDGLVGDNYNTCQSPDFKNTLVFQQIIGDQNGTAYGMNPSIFEIIDGIMSMKQQPKANKRVRYESDGRRFLPDSRYHPMSLNLPNLQLITLADNQTLGVIITIVTSIDNPNYSTYVHANDIIYRDEGVIQIAHGCCFVPLKSKDIKNGVKEFPRLSIVYKKYINYTFDVTPFDPQTMFGITQTYIVPNDNTMEKVAKGKLFKIDFNLASYKLIFQLALKENNSIHISNISCQTEDIHEQLPKEISGKRRVSDSPENYSDDDIEIELKNLTKSKKFKSSTPRFGELPVSWLKYSMDTHPYATDDLGQLFYDNSTSLESVNAETNISASSTLVEYDYNPSDSFSDTVSPESSLPDNMDTCIKELIENFKSTESKTLQLVYPLENTYRARYKSDYFPQNGTVRRPRYIADNRCNHFITLRLPTDYKNELKNDYVRVALITIFIEDHGHYYSPYKFQKNHDDINVPDENPIYIKIDDSRQTKSIIQLQLVLIKSKLDQLNYVQPLRPFSDTNARIQNINHEEQLTPKDLINRYQLEKSHLAFTLCAKLSNGFYQMHPETTVISSIITEIPTVKKPKTTALFSSDNTKHSISCPVCAHCFDPDTPLKLPERSLCKSSHEASHSYSKTDGQIRANKKKKK
ncbi:unnamed protein product [Rotaria socialis]